MNFVNKINYIILYHIIITVPLSKNLILSAKPVLLTLSFYTTFLSSYPLLLIKNYKLTAYRELQSQVISPWRRMSANGCLHHSHSTQNVVGGLGGCRLPPQSLHRHHPWNTPNKNTIILFTTTDVSQSHI